MRTRRKARPSGCDWLNQKIVTSLGMLAVPYSIRCMLKLYPIGFLELPHRIGQLEGEEVFLGRVGVLRNFLVAVLKDGVALDLHDVIE